MAVAMAVAVAAVAAAAAAAAAVVLLMVVIAIAGSVVVLVVAVAAAKTACRSSATCAHTIPATSAILLLTKRCTNMLAVSSKSGKAWHVLLRRPHQLAYCAMASSEDVFTKANDSCLDSPVAKGCAAFLQLQPPTVSLLRSQPGG